MQAEGRLSDQDRTQLVIQGRGSGITKNAGGEILRIPTPVPPPQGLGDPQGSEGPARTDLWLGFLDYGVLTFFRPLRRLQRQMDTRAGRK